MSNHQPMITVSAGLVAAKHIGAMGPALAEFLCLIDWQTDKSGLVRGGAPVRIEEIADRLGRHRRTVERNLQRLANYLDVRRTPYGLVIRIRNPKKWFRHDKNVASGYDTSVASPPERYDKSGGLDTTEMSETKKTNTRNKGGQAAQKTRRPPLFVLTETASTRLTTRAGSSLSRRGSHSPATSVRYRGG